MKLVSKLGKEEKLGQNQWEVWVYVFVYVCMCIYILCVCAIFSFSVLCESKFPLDFIIFCYLKVKVSTVYINMFISK